MKTRKLGRFDVSLVGLGCNNFGAACDEKQSADVIAAALDAGINFFDTADVYGGGMSERFVGKSLASVRDEVVIASKFRHPLSERVDGEMRQIEGTGGAHPAWIRKAIDGSLQRLDTDRIDLYQLHAPDPEVPIEETLDELTRLVKDGKVIEIGCSNFTVEQIEEAARVSTENNFAQFVSVQNHYNLLNFETQTDVLEVCKRDNLAYLPYFPLASGLLTGKYRQGEDPSEGRLARVPKERRDQLMSDRAFAIIEELETFAATRQRSLLEIAMSWLAADEVIASVIAGATKPEQVRANVGAVGWEMTAEEVTEIAAIASQS